MKSKKKKSNFLQILTGLLLFCHFCVLTAFVFSLMAGIFPTDKLWIFSFFGLIYFPLYVANIGFTILWMVMWRKYWMLSIVPLVFGFMIFWGHFNIRFAGPYTRTNEDLKVMTFNVRGFEPPQGTPKDAFMKEAFSRISDERPDIIGFQDYTIPIKGRYGIEGLQQLLGLPYAASNNYSVYSDHVSVNGVGILSRYPIISSQPIAVDSGYTCIAADILYHSRKIRVISLHLQSYALFTNEKVILRAPRTFSHFDEQRITRDSRKIAGKLRWGFRRRAPEARKVAAFIKDFPYPVILCGDFNDTPASYAYRTISRSLEDPFLKYGSGIAKTYNESRYPFRIDYILHTKQFVCKDFHILHTKLSDHNPVTAIFKME
jgi:endonuclease/exonuclease/phosphatase family metal-dependent hydrolase